MSTDERRALAIILTILLAAAVARWLDRPTPLLDDVAALDLEKFEDDSRQAAAPKKKPTAPAAKPRAQLDLNTATVQQIDSLPGIGRAVAERIIAQRATAPFRYHSDLRNVRGVGPALAARLAPLVLLSEDPPPAPPPAVPPPASVEKPAGPIDLNRATAAELETLPGVGPALAARLLAWRDSAGRFASWEDVDRVAGVGPALLAKLKVAARL
jgi:competence ComEA-like helix-hairpin-helix protein